VHPETTVYELRQELESQINCNLLPSEFVFLRCVGRCFTVVCHWSCLWSWSHGYKTAFWPVLTIFSHHSKQKRSANIYPRAKIHHIAC